MKQSQKGEFEKKANIADHSYSSARVTGNKVAKYDKKEGID